MYTYVDLTDVTNKSTSYQIYSGSKSASWKHWALHNLFQAWLEEAKQVEILHCIFSVCVWGLITALHIAAVHSC